MAFTIDPFNGSLQPGVFQPDSIGLPLSTVLAVSELHTVFLGGYYGDLWAVNTSTLHGAYQVKIPGVPDAMAYDNATRRIWTGGYTSVDIIAADNGSLLKRMSFGSGGQVGIAYDSKGDRMFIANWGIPSIVVCNATTGNETKTIGLPFEPSMLYYDRPRDRLLIGDSSDRLIHLLNGSSLTFAPTTWPVGSNSLGAALDPVHDWLYVANSGSNNVSIINLSDGRPFARAIAVGQSPSSIAYFPPTHSILVANSGSHNISEIPANGSSIASSNGSIRCTQCSGQLAYDSSSGDVFVPRQEGFSGYLGVLDPAKSQPVLPDVPISLELGNSALDTKNGTIYFVNPSGPNGGNGSIVGFNATTRSIIAESYTVGAGPSAIVYDSAVDELIVTDSTGATISVVSLSGGSVAQIRLGPSTPWNATVPAALAVDPGRDLAFVADEGADNLSVVNLSSRSIVETIPVGTSPDAVLWDAPYRQIFVANWGSNNVTAINETTLSPVTSIPTGSGPSGLTFDPPLGEILVSNSNSGNLTVIDPKSDRAVGSGPGGGFNSPPAYDASNGYLYFANYGYSEAIVSNATTLEPVGSPISLLRTASQDFLATPTYDPLTDEIWYADGLQSVVYVVANVPSIESSTATPSPTEVGVPFDVTAMISNGTAPFQFAYSGLPPGCAGTGSSSVWCYPRTPGNYSISIGIRDARGYTSSSIVPVQILPALHVSALDISTSYMEVGQTLSLLVRESGGIGAYTFSYTGLPLGCHSENAPEFTCAPAAEGSYSITATVIDSLSVSGSATAGVGITSMLTLVSSWSSTNSLRVGGSGFLVSQVAGGAPSYTYSYSNLPAGCMGSNTPLLPCVPSSAGEYAVTVSVRDGLGVTTGVKAPVTVLPAIGTPPPRIQAFIATPPVLYLGNSTTLWVLLTGPLASSSLGFTGMPAGCNASNVTTVSCAPTAIGTFLIRVNVGSGTIVGESANLNLTVLPDPVSPLPPRFASAPPSAPVWLWGTSIAIALIAAAAVGALVANRRNPRL